MSTSQILRSKRKPGLPRKEKSLELWIPTQPQPPNPIREVEKESEVSLARLVLRVESSSVSKSLTHDADLSDLWDYYVTAVRRGRMCRDKILAKDCGGDCRNVTFTYPAAVIFRHPKQVMFARALMALEYRYCKDCSTLMPKSQILELEKIREARKPREKRKPPRHEGMPIKCPCCTLKTAHVKVLVRKTKMGKKLFKGEGY